jgi:DNA-binding transcriptional MerR regulator
MNIGQTVKTIQKEYPSVTISRLRFLEKEGLIFPSRTKGGTRYFNKKDIARILSILDLQEIQFYSLKAIKNNPKLITNSTKVQIIINEYSFHDALKKSGLSNSQFEELLDFNLEIKKEIYSQEDVNRFMSFSYFFSLGFSAKNFTIFKSMADRGAGFMELVKNNIDDEDDLHIAIDNFISIIGSFISDDI